MFDQLRRILVPGIEGGKFFGGIEFGGGIGDAHDLRHPEHPRNSAAIRSPTEQDHIRMEISHSQHLFHRLAFVVDGKGVQNHPSRAISRPFGAAGRIEQREPDHQYLQTPAGAAGGEIGDSGIEFQPGGLRFINQQRNTGLFFQLQDGSLDAKPNVIVRRFYRGGGVG